MGLLSLLLFSGNKAVPGRHRAVHGGFKGFAGSKGSCDKTQ